MFWIAILIVLGIALAVSVMVDRRNARAGIDWSGSDDSDGHELTARKPRTLRDRVGVERWSDLLPFGLYIGLVIVVLALAAAAFFIWRDTVIEALAALGLQREQLSGGYQLAVWMLGILLFVVFAVAQRSLQIASQDGRLWQRFAVWAGALGAAIALGWICSLLLG